MSFANRFAKSFRYLMPSPFALAVLLTLLTFILALAFTLPEQSSVAGYAWQLGKDWTNEIWNGSLMVFAMQMMLMLVLGHALALSPLVEKAIQRFVHTFCKTQASAAAAVTFFTVLVALFNWGFGLIFGAIFARKVGEHFKAQNKALNYPLIGAAGYSGLMVWHGGISGSSLVKVAEEGHLQSMMAGTALSPDQLLQLPSQIPFAETVFSSMNVFATVLLLIALPTVMYVFAKRSTALNYTLTLEGQKQEARQKASGAERIDASRIWGLGLGALLLVLSFAVAWQHPALSSMGFINPNWINLLLLGLSLLLHGNFNRFTSAISNAIGGAAGILIQFPLYFGIMGLMKSSGMVGDMALWFAQIATAETYPIFTFFSAGLVNIFVPSGGGQWAVQGPILIQAAQDLGLSLSKSIMALAYGDQLTNMLQPFWALPLLGITQLKAKDILPYTLILMVIGAIIFMAALLLF